LPGFTVLVLQHKNILSAAIWTPAFMLFCLLLVLVLANLVPAVRRWLRFHLPIMRDTAFAQFASSMGLMLQGGCPLRDCVAVLARIEGGSSLGRELAGWETRLQAGAAKFLDVAGPKGLLPPFFKWLVASAGEDLPGGFRQAAELYRTRALRARDMILYAALPVATVILGGIIAVQVYCICVTLLGISLPLINMMDYIGQ
jgi:type II secretory pathway component PulF